jgi:hypothetical protein
LLGEFVWISTGSYRQYKVIDEKVQDEEVIVAASSFAASDSRYVNLYKVTSNQGVKKL